MRTTSRSYWGLFQRVDRATSLEYVVFLLMPKLSDSQQCLTAETPFLMKKRAQTVPQCSAALQLNQPPEDAHEKIALPPSGWRALLQLFRMPQLTLSSSVSRATIILKLCTKLVQGRVKLIKRPKEKIGILRGLTGLWKDSFELHLTVTSVPCSWSLPLWAVSACLPPCQLGLFISPSLQAQ